jgi:hypothetical protein
MSFGVDPSFTWDTVDRRAWGRGGRGRKWHRPRQQEVERSAARMSSRPFRRLAASAKGTELDHVFKVDIGAFNLTAPVRLDAAVKRLAKLEHCGFARHSLTIAYRIRFYPSAVAKPAKARSSVIVADGSNLESREGRGAEISGVSAPKRVSLQL